MDVSEHWVLGAHWSLNKQSAVLNTTHENTQTMSFVCHRFVSEALKWDHKGLSDYQPISTHPRPPPVCYLITFGKFHRRLWSYFSVKCRLSRRSVRQPLFSTTANFIHLDIHLACDQKLLVVVPLLRAIFHIEEFQVVWTLIVPQDVSWPYEALVNSIYSARLLTSQRFCSRS